MKCFNLKTIGLVCLVLLVQSSKFKVQSIYSVSDSLSNGACPMKYTFVFYGARVVRGKSYNIKELINSENPLTEEEIKFIVSNLKIRGLTIDDLVKKFFFEKDGVIYLNYEELYDFVYGSEFETKPLSYPFKNIGTNSYNFEDFLEDLLSAMRWQKEYPEVIKENRYGKFGTIIALAANIFYIRGLGRFLMFDPLSVDKEAIVRPLILGNLFITGLGRKDGRYKGKYYRVIDEKRGMIVSLEYLGLSKSGKAYIEEVYTKQDEVWIRWDLKGQDTKVVTDDKHIYFLNSLIENN